MALTEQERQEWFDVIERTGQFRVEAIKEREIPDWYRAFAEEVTREERTFEFEGLRPVRVVITKAKELSDHAPLHINMHGGGFWFKQNEDDDLYCAHIAAKTHGVVLDIDYAVVSEAPFPMAFEQSYRVVSWAVEHCVELGADPERISIGGMSAGGNLAAAIALRAAGTKDFELCLLVLDNAGHRPGYGGQDSGKRTHRRVSELYADGDHRPARDPLLLALICRRVHVRGHAPDPRGQRREVPVQERERTVRAACRRPGFGSDHQVLHEPARTALPSVSPANGPRRRI